MLQLEVFLSNAATKPYSETANILASVCAIPKKEVAPKPSAEVQSLFILGVENWTPPPVAKTEPESYGIAEYTGDGWEKTFRSSARTVLVKSNRAKINRIKGTLQSYKNALAQQNIPGSFNGRFSPFGYSTKRHPV